MRRFNRVNKSTRLALANPKHVKRLSKELLAKGKDIKVVDATAMVRHKITGASNKTKLILVQDSRQVGYTDFEKGKLDEDKNLVVREVSFAIATDTLANASDEADVYYTKKIAATTDAAIRSAVLTIRQENKKLFEEKVSNLMCEQLEEGANGNNGYVLEEEFLITEGKTVEAELEFPNGKTVSVAEDWFAELTLIGGSTAQN